MAAIKKQPAKKKSSAKVVKPAAKAAKTAKPLDAVSVLKAAILKVLDDRQAADVVAVDLRGKSCMADWAIIASGRSSRHVAAMAECLAEELKAISPCRIATEGLPQGDWALVDMGDVIVHLFRPEVRLYYDLESMWKSRPSDAPATAAKAKASSKKTAAKKPAIKKAPAKKAATPKKTARRK